MVLILENIEKELKLAKRHMNVLRLIIKHEPIGILRLSQATGIPDQQIRYSMRILQECGFLGPSTKGAVTNESAGKFMKSIRREKSLLIKHVNVL